MMEESTRKPFIDRSTAASLGLDAYMERAGPVYQSHWIAWKDKGVPDPDLPMERYMDEVALETCCLGMLAHILQGNELVKPILGLLMIEQKLKADKEGLTPGEFHTAKRRALMDHHRVFPHPPEIDAALRKAGWLD